LGVSYSYEEAYYVYEANEHYVIGQDSYAPHTAYLDTTAKHRIGCSEVGTGPAGSVGHDVSITFVRVTPSNDGAYKIGDSGPAGGIVFYVSEDGMHGLEAAPVDQMIPRGPGTESAGAEWGCYLTLVPGADGTAVGAGEQNTADILAGCMDTPIAADIAAGYMLNGFSDWFLPSKDELRELFLNRDFVGGFSIGNGYWSSSEVDGDNAWVLFPHSYGGSSSYNAGKYSRYGVRAVRAF